MVYFRPSLKAPCIIWVLLTITATNPISFEGKGDLPSLPIIKQFLQHYVQPYLRTLPNINYPNFRATKVNVMDTFIKDKVVELKPFLQDGDAPIKVDSDDKITLEGEEDTTIVEFPVELKDKSHLRNSNTTSESYKAIQRYKSLRDEIKTALEKESVSRKTKKLVTHTLDDMIAQMIGNQCTWKSGTAMNANFRNLKRNLTKGKDHVAMARAWNSRWRYLKHAYLNRKDKNKEMDAFIQQFQHFISNITDDLKLLSTDYKIECQLLNKNKYYDSDKFDETNRAKVLSRKKNLVINEPCENFRLCSDELTDFMKDFYLNLNDTTVSVLRNYASMYNRDITDEDEKDITIKLIIDSSNKLEKGLKGTFKRQTNKFKPDKAKNSETNIKALTNYVQKTIKHAKKRVKKDLMPNLTQLKKRLEDTIGKDIFVNLDLELSNLELDLSSRICTIFETCNGRYASRRQEGGTYIGDKDGVYVKVQLSIDEDKLSSNKNQLRRTQSNQQQNTAYNRFMTFTNPQIASASKNVTRTTLFVAVTQNVSTITITPSMKLNELDSNFVENDNNV